MNRIYSTDECNDLNAFLKEIKRWQRDGKIEWYKEDLDTYKILNLDLDESETEELSILFEELDVYEIGIVEDDDWNPYYDEDEGDDYSGYSKRGKKYEDDEDF